MQRRGPASLSGWLLIAASVLWVTFLAVPHLQARAVFLDSLESWLLDLRYRILGPQESAPGIVFVAIDDATLEAGQSGPVGRARLTRLINHIADSGARALVVDVLLADAGPITERVSLAAALSRLPTVIAAAVRIGADGDTSVIMPHAHFQAQAEVGVVNLSLDAGGTPRYIPLFIEAEGALLPSLSLLAAASLSDAPVRITDRNLLLDDRRIPLDVAANLPLRLLGPAGTVPTISAQQIMEAGPHQALSDKLVVLGYSAAAMGDRFVTPFDEDTPGAEIIATAISQLVSGETLRRDNQIRLWDVVHAASVALVCLLATMRLPLLKALPLVCGLLALSFGISTGLFAEGIWLNAALPLAATLPPVALAGASVLLRDRKAAERSDRSLASLRRFQSPAIARRIENDPDFLSAPVTRDLVILFVDLTGFTTLSQRLGPDGTRDLLQRFHALTTSAIEDQGGIVINYMGDGALAIFGLEPDHHGRTDADCALAAAGALERSLAAETPMPRLRPLDCRIGLHHGPVILSRLGADNHQQVTVSGDTVNLASRLLELAKAEQARRVATEQFVQRLGADAALYGTRQARLAVRGRSGHVDVTIWRISPGAAAGAVPTHDQGGA